MAVLYPISGPGYESKLYFGTAAERQMRTVQCEAVAQGIANDSESVIILYRRHNFAGRREAGVYYSPIGDDTSELLRLFSKCNQCYGIARTVYEDLVEVLGFSPCAFLSWESMGPKYACSVCSQKAIWKFVQEVTVFGSTKGEFASDLFACDEHMSYVLGYLKAIVGGVWLVRYIGNRRDRGIKPPMPDL